MRKHGIENFTFEVIEECSTKELTDEREKFWIAHFDSRNREKGYNLHVGGRSGNDESFRKLSEALKGNTHCVGRIASPETCEKLKKCGRITTERRFGAKEIVTEERVCHCGKTFTVTYSINRKAYVRGTCSTKCSQSRERSIEIRNKIAASLRFEPPEALLLAIKANTPLVQLATEFDVSYSTLKRLKRKVTHDSMCL
jgi:hypothetical protein